MSLLFRTFIYLHIELLDISLDWFSKVKKSIFTNTDTYNTMTETWKMSEFGLNIAWTKTDKTLKFSQFARVTTYF